MKSKIAIINFSGNVGKSTLAKQLFAPRMQAQEFAVETINAGAGETTASERLKGKDFGHLQEEMMRTDAAIVDIGASNVDEFVKLMGQFDGSHEEFDYFIVPVVSDKKQQTDTINTIKTLAGLGVPSKKIRVVFNKVAIDDADDVASHFSMVWGFHAAEKKFTLRTDAVVFTNEIFDRLRILNTSVDALVADDTDYRTMLKDAKDDDAKDYAISMISAKRLAKSAHKNLDDVFKVLFK
ncbi:StbB family protein [Glaciimonas sp. Gout2]|uniref:StbB family protein n=1 Tax=unclassified Glaciimonas TaxID=2644401 RepID=UPI002B23D0E2|nr:MULTISPECIES: StbB family protein [unclassified Glaciimonas]MEB0013921.1 StbB family protein [Glaciimonas sp. Cout2]MEB0083118.1 StbB family protein [Glaciimonas sp. Gout2]